MCLYINTLEEMQVRTEVTTIHLGTIISMYRIKLFFTQFGVSL